MVTWNWLDCILAAIVVASVITAVMKGFVQELISLAIGTGRPGGGGLRLSARGGVV